MDSTHHGTPVRNTPGWFSTTHWSVVLAAGSEWCDLAQQALEGLCRTYWRPVHEYVRRWGYAPHDAEDLTQQFFAQFIKKEHYRLADRQRGKFPPDGTGRPKVRSQI
jgi:RNA polymerase sigma-70 factor (ECF subfamily)